MRIVDLSRELYHRTPAHPSHPPVVMTVWNDHDEIKEAGGVKFSSKAMSVAMSDHAGTHIDAPCHFNPAPDAASIDQMPLENFYTEGLCLDLSAAPLRHEITVAEMEAALKASGEEIKPRDTVLLHMGVNARLWGTPGYLHDFPGLHVDAVHWLADKGILQFGVEAISPAPEGAPNFKAHMACGERGILYRMPLEPGGAGRRRALPLRRISAEAEGRHRQPDPRRRDIRGIAADGQPERRPADLAARDQS